MTAAKHELTPFDAAAALGTAESQAAYPNAALEENDPGAFLAALGTVRGTQGMTGTAMDTGLSTDALLESLGGGAVASLDTVLRVLHGLGMKVSLQPEEKAAA